MSEAQEMNASAATPTTYVNILQAMIDGDRQLLAKLCDFLPDGVENVLGSAWDKFAEAVDGAFPVHDVAHLGQEIRTELKEAIATGLEKAEASVGELIKVEVDQVSAHLGNLIQAMAEFSSGNHGLLTSMLQAGEGNSLLAFSSPLAAPASSEHVQGG